jgi:RNA polymerase sigma factor (sigma-70 family)
MGDAAFPLVTGRSRVLGLRLLRDERLAVLAATGNTHAFGVIYERHHAALFRYCRSLLIDQEDAGDALQNTMLNAFRALSAGKKDLALRPWLYRIAHNESVSLLRRRRPAAPLEAAAEVPARALDRDVEAAERLRQLVVDLGELSEAQRGALVMRELSGLSYADIALTLGVSPDAAKQQVHAAHTALHDIAGGRAMDCDAARESLSINDRRLVRGRKLSAHLRSCDGCRAFQEGVMRRRSDLMALAPPLPVGAAAALFAGLFGGGGGGAAGGGGLIAGGGAAAAGASSSGGGGLLASLTGGAGGNGGLLASVTGGNVVAGSAAAKALVPVAVTIGVGAGGMGLTEDAGKAERMERERPVAGQVVRPPATVPTPLDRAVAEIAPAGSNVVPHVPGIAPAPLTPAGEPLPAPAAQPPHAAPASPAVEAPVVPFISEGTGAEPPLVLEGSLAEPDIDVELPAPAQPEPAEALDSPDAPEAPAPVQPGVSTGTGSETPTDAAPEPPVTAPSAPEGEVTPVPPASGGDALQEGSAGMGPGGEAPSAGDGTAEPAPLEPDESALTPQ